MKVVGGSAEAMVEVMYYFIGINSYVGRCIHSLVVVFDDKATHVMSPPYRYPEVVNRK